MTEDADPAEHVQSLAEEFLRQHRAGKRPSLESYCDLHPAAADEIREVIETLLLLEELKPTSDELSARTFVPKSEPPDVVQIGGYRIVREIGRGGMGIVFEAEQESLNRKVALKVISRRGQKHSDGVARFEREARAAARMHHTNIVPVFEVGSDDHYLFYAMQLISGRSLDHVIQDVARLNRQQSVPEEAGPTGSWETRTSPSDMSLPLIPAAPHPPSASQRARTYFHDAARVIQQAAGALSYAHSRGVVHRDIKPSNLLLDESGTVWMTDFGLARTGDNDLTQTGDLLGTLRYMSPERFLGECDERADIYALGLTLYELLVLQPAFSAADGPQMVEQIRHHMPPRPRTLDPRVPRDLETIVLKCIETDPQLRYQTATELENELTRFLSNEPIRARPTGLPERVTRWCARNPLPTILAIAAAVCLSAGTTVSTLFAISANRNRQLADQRAGTIAIREAQTLTLLAQVDAQRQRAETELVLSERLLNLNRIQSADREWKSHRAVTAWRHLNAYRGSNYEWEHRFLVNLFRRSHSTWAGHADDVNAFDVSADGELIISASGGRWKEAPTAEILIYHRPTAQTRQVRLTSNVRITDVALHPNGLQFAAADTDGTVEIRNVSDGSLLTTYTGHPGPVNSLQYHPDGSQLAAGTMTGSVSVWETTEGQLLFDAPGHTHQIAELCYNPDGSLIASAGWDRNILLRDARTGELRQTLSGHKDAVYCAAFNSDGTRLVTGCWDGEILLWDIVSGQSIQSLRGHALAVYAVAFSPSDHTIVSGSYDQKLRVWDAATGTTQRILEGHTGTIHDVDYSSDGSQIISGSSDQTIRFWDSGDSDHVLTIRDHGGDATAVTFSPDSQLVFASGQHIRGFDVSTGQQAIQLEQPIYTAAFAWSPDQKTLAGAGWDGLVGAWDVSTGRSLFRVSPASTAIVSICFSPDGSQIAAGSLEGRVYLVCAASGRIQDSFAWDSGQVRGLAWSPDGASLFVGGSGGDLIEWRSKTGERIRKFNNIPSIYCMAISHDGKQLVSGGPTPDISVWDIRSGQRSRLLSGHVIQVFGLALQPSGQRMIVGGSEHSLELWDLNTGEATLALEGHTDSVLAVAFSPDGHRIASSSRDGTVRVWDATEPERLQNPDDHHPQHGSSP